MAEYGTEWQDLSEDVEVRWFSPSEDINKDGALEFRPKHGTLRGLKLSLRLSEIGLVQLLLRNAEDTERHIKETS